MQRLQKGGYIELTEPPPMFNVLMPIIMCIYFAVKHNTHVSPQADPQSSNVLQGYQVPTYMHTIYQLPRILHVYAHEALT